MKKDFWRSPFIRFFFPRSADWTVKENPYATHHKYEIYSLENPYLKTDTNDFRSHM
jgi:hypothetical protein